MQHPPKISIGPPHPDPIVETSSLSAVQPPEPTYDLKIKDVLESSKVLSCLQIETLVYACQVVLTTQLVIFLTSKLHHFHLHLVILTETPSTPSEWRKGWIFHWRWSWCRKRKNNCRVNLGELAPWDEESVVRFLLM